MRQLRPTELKEYLEQADPKPQLLDVREPWEYHTCHIAGSDLLPMREIPGALDSLDPEREIVLICHHGIRSRQVGRYLAHLGFGRLINLAGGVDAWAREVDPRMPTY
jgi:rhodanese-related sulfurtransferase